MMIGAALAAVALSALPSAAASLDDQLLAGCALLGSGRVVEAGARFTQALATDPRCAEARVGRGAVLLRQGPPALALAEFEAALAQQAGWSAAELGRGAALVMLGRLPEAAQAYASAASTPGLAGRQARAAQAWALCAQGDWEGARKLIAAGDSGSALSAYVRAATELVLAPTAVGSLEGEASPADSLVSLGGCLAPLPGLTGGAAGPYVASGAAGGRPVVPLQILTPAAGSQLRGVVPLLVRGRPTSPVATVVVTVGGQLAALGGSLVFPEPLDTTLWPGGQQALEVQAFDATGGLVGQGAVLVEVLSPDLTYAEPPPAVSPWVARDLERLLTPGLRPGVWDHLRGRLAWQQTGPAGALAPLSAAFVTDPTLPQVGDDLQAVARACGLPVGQPTTRLRQVATSRRVVALTFDDGPHPKLTPWILDQLDRYSAHATFFLVGKQVRMYPELTRSILARGHELATHSYSHQDMTTLTPLEVERELVGGRAAIAEATGTQVTLFRPPGGNYDGAVGRAAVRWGFTPVLWSCNICDFYDNPPSHVVGGMLSRIEPGGIVLLHNGEDLTVDILPQLLQALREDGWRMVSVSELLATRD